MQSDSTLFIFQGNVSGSYTNNNSNTIFQTRTTLSTQVKTKDLQNTFFLIGDHRLLRTKTADIANALFLHLRYNRTLTPQLKGEVFIQVQNDQILAIKSRRLFGIGLRVEVYDSENVSVFLGNSYMYENEEADAAVETVHHRNSSYFTLSASLPNTPIGISSTTYYQPLYKDFSDFRLLEQLNVTFAISDVVSLFGLFNYYQDSVTPANMRQFSSTTTAGLRITL